MATIKDVAREAGVAISTVSKVINRSSKISEATIARVERVMKDLNYFPNSIARSFVRQSSRTIGMVMDLKRGDAFNNPYMYEILGGIEEETHKRGYMLTLTNLRNAADKWTMLEPPVKEKRIDGLLLHVPDVDREILERLDALSFPYVVIGEPEFAYECCWVDVNNRQAGKMAAVHLLETGCRSLAFVGLQPGDHISCSRRDGVLEAMSAAGIGALVDWEGPGGAALGQRAAKSFLENRSKGERGPDGIICSSSQTAAGLLAGLARGGVRIPDELSVMGFDRYPVAGFTDPSLSVVDIDVFGLGLKAAATLFDKMDQPETLQQVNLFSSRLILQGSTRALK